MGNTITITVSERDAYLILRSIKARINHYCNRDVIARVDNDSGIRSMYGELEALVENQLADQGLET